MELVVALHDSANVKKKSVFNENMTFFANLFLCNYFHLSVQNVKTQKASCTGINTTQFFFPDWIPRFSQQKKDAVFFCFFFSALQISVPCSDPTHCISWSWMSVTWVLCFLVQHLSVTPESSTEAKLNKKNFKYFH